MTRLLLIIVGCLFITSLTKAQIFSTGRPPDTKDHSISVGAILTGDKELQSFSLYTEHGFVSFPSMYFGLAYGDGVTSFTIGPELPLVGDKRGLINDIAINLAIYPTVTYNTDSDWSLAASLAISQPLNNWLEPYLGFGFSYPFEEGSKIELSTIAPGLSLSFTSFSLMVEYDLKSKLTATAISWPL